MFIVSQQLLVHKVQICYSELTTEVLHPRCMQLKHCQSVLETKFWCCKDCGGLLLK